MNSNASLSLEECAQDMIKTNVTRPFVLPWWQQMVWSLVFGTMVSIAIIGNTIIMWIIIAHRRMRTVTNYFLLNLSITDFSMVTFNAIFNFVYMLESNWPFGYSYCVFNNFVANVTVSTSVFTMTIMSIDRYMAIVYPLTPRMSSRTVYIIIAIIWCLSAVLAIPTLLYSTVNSYGYGHCEIRTLCFLSWPDGLSGLSKTDYWYNVILLLLTYVIPMVIMALAYTSMGSVLWGSARIGETTERQETVMKSKQKVVKMLITVVILFGVCWLPYHVYFLYSYNNPSLAYSDYVQHLYLGIYWMAMSNSMYNPIVYYWMNARFRAYFEVVLCWCWYRRGRRQSSHRRSTSFSTRTKSFRLTLTLSKTLSIKRSLKEKNCVNNMECHPL